MSTYDDIVNLALRRSLFYPASELYPNSPAGFYDYGPFGASIRRKIIETWRKLLVQKEEFLEISGAITMPEDVFKASGHLTNFNDPVTQCVKCKTLHRADKLLSDATGKEYKEAMTNEELTAALREYKLRCPCKGELGDVKKMNMMVRAEIGVANKSSCYLRPESCQSIFADWARMVKTMRVKLPKGVSQVGTVFRNEISPRQTLLRQVEFSQMETEVFFDPEKINEAPNWEEVQKYALSVQLAAETTPSLRSLHDLVSKNVISGKIIAYYLARTQQLYEALGIPVGNMRFRQLDNQERAFYAKEAFDFEVKTSLGWVELIANNYRTDYDLKGHAAGSKQDLSYLDDAGRKFVPHVWEISIGVDRTFYAVLENSYHNEGERTWLSLPPSIASLHAGVFPLLSNKPELVNKAREVYQKLREKFEIQYDASGSVGKRYARMDEIGVPYCLTIDFDSLAKNDVTLRDRDTTVQKRVLIEALPDVLRDLISGRVTVAELK